MTSMKPTHETVEARLAGLDPAIELLAVEASGREGLRIVVDHPEGVSLELCGRVTSSLSELLEDNFLEVSSPGPERPLVRPGHFRRFTGKRARITTVEPIDGRRNFTGTIREPELATVGIESDGVLFRIAHNDIKRAHLVPDIPEGADR